MLMSSADIIYLSLSIITFALYVVLLKKTPSDRYLITLFWVQACAYSMYIFVYLFRKIILQHDVSAIEKLLHAYTFTNAPLYALYAVCFLWSIVIFRDLLVQFDVSLIVPFSQVSLLMTYLGITFLGDPFSWLEFAGIIVICVGAIVTATSHFDVRSPERLLTTLPPALVKGVAKEAILKACTLIIIYLITTSTSTNETIITSLGHVFPFAQYESFYANLGTRFFITAIFYWMLRRQDRYKNSIFSTLTTYWREIVGLSLIYFVSTMTYQFAFYLTEDKGMLAALTKLNVPVLLFFASVILKETMTSEKIIGSLIVVCGIGIVLYAQ